MQFIIVFTAVFLSILDASKTQESMHQMTYLNENFGQTALAREIDNDKLGNSLVHSRKRRYVVFPEGSTFTVAFCTSIKAITGRDTIFTEGINWALSYDLPNETLHDKSGKLRPAPMRRHKRELYEKVEILMDSAGLNGRDCVLRTICETSQLISPRRGIVQEIIRLLFTYPLEKEMSSRRPGRHREYGAAHQIGMTDQNCHDLFPCPISLLELLLRFGMKNTDQEVY